MTFEWRVLLKIAVRILSSSAGEGEFRTSVNRSYYAALGEAREFCLKNGLVMVPRRPSHEQIWQFLRNGGNEVALWRKAAFKAIGDEGVALRAMRVQADYKLISAPVEQDAKNASVMSSRIIKRLNGL